MDKTLEARLLGRDNMVLDVWYYYCAYVVYVVMLLCDVVHMWCCPYIVCLHFVYGMLCTAWYK